MSSIDPNTQPISASPVIPQKQTPDQITKKSQEDLNSILHKNDDLSGASSVQNPQKSAEKIRAKSEQDLEEIQSASSQVDSVDISAQAVNANANSENDLNDNSNEDNSKDILANAQQYLKEYNQNEDQQVKESDDDSTEDKLKEVFGASKTSQQLNGYRQQMKDYFGVDLFARGRNNGGTAGTDTDKSTNFANFTDDKGNLRDINGYMDTLQRVKTDNPSARITSAANLQDYARDHYDDDLNYVKDGDAENTFGEQRHEEAKDTNSKSEEYSFKDHLSQVGRDMYKERYSRTDSDQSQGVREMKSDDSFGSAKANFLNAITQNMASDTASFDQADYADIQMASQDLNDDITSSDTTYAVSGAGRS